jgi:hypothetical protein
MSSDGNHCVGAIHLDLRMPSAEVWNTAVNQLIEVLLANNAKRRGARYCGKTWANSGDGASCRRIYHRINDSSPNVPSLGLCVTRFLVRRQILRFDRRLPYDFVARWNLK